jgi:putative ABC transport system permease protein
MLRIALKNILGRKGRLVLSALAVIAGCGFLSGVFVLSDTINGSIDKLFATAFEKTDAYVRSAVSIDSGFGGKARGTIPDSTIAQVETVQGVAVADGDVQGTAIITDPDGKVVGGGGPPQFGSVFTESPISPWTLKTGRAASGPNEVVLDVHTAKLAKVGVGDKVTISTTAAPQEFTIVGIVNFAGSDSTGGPTWALFDLPTAESFVLGQPGMISSISVGGDGTRSETELKNDIQALFPRTEIEALTGKEITKESQSDLADQFSFFTTFLTIFAGISMFVGSFVIYNVFKISAAQRLRENALLRAIGARSSQVTFALFVEALAVGILGGVIGFGVGVGLATVITLLLNASGGGAGDTSLVISGGSFAITLIVGVIVTLVCATFPALRAGRVPPLAAMRDVAIDRSGASRKRLIVGSVSGVLAVLGIALGLTSSATWLVLGVVGLFLSIIAFGPAVVGPISNMLTKPLGKLRGVTGEIAGRNAARSPERTALTAAALGIGLALLVAVSTLASSLQTSLRETFGKAFVGDVAVSPEGNGGFLPATLATDLGKLPEIKASVGFSAGLFKIDKADGTTDDNVSLTLDPTAAPALVQLHFEQGDWTIVRGDTIIVSREAADSKHYSVGDTFDVSFLNGSTGTFTVGGIFTDKIFGDYIADRAAFAGSGQPALDNQVAALSAPGVSQSQLDAALKTIGEQYPSAKIQSKEAFIDEQIDGLSVVLNLIYGLLAMSVFIAVLGIVLTLLLGVYERRRELGLMRAIGTTRGQIRGSIRWEAVITAVLGALMGIGLGLALGWIVVTALKDQGLNKFSVAPGSLVVFAILAVVLALLAALVPSRRAARAPILEAIATT